MLRNNRKTIFLIATAAVILACVSPLTPATPIPPFDPSFLNTSVAQTANAAATQTASLWTPTATITLTPAPTRTPTETFTPIADLSYLAYSPTPFFTATVPTVDGSREYSCALLGQSPEDNSPFSPGASFSTRWQVKNTGSALWSVNNVDYLYVSGDKLHIKKAYDLYKDVATGGVADFIVDMKAPSNKGSYTTTWKIRIGSREFCTLTLIINVR